VLIVRTVSCIIKWKVLLILQLTHMK
jgi:hypothetical protein